MTEPLPFEIPVVLRAHRAAVNGQAGADWFDRLPELVRAFARRWELTLFAPFPNLSYNFVAPVQRADGSAAVLKLNFPDQEAVCEIEAMRRFPREAAVEVLEADEPQGAMLLERVTPGKSLRGVPDTEAVAATCAVIRKLHRPLAGAHPFPTVANWGEVYGRIRRHYGGTSGPFPQALFDEGEETYFALVASSGPTVLLHGDLHHDNILTATREPFLAFDPHGVAGEAEYECGSFLRNWLPDLLELPDPAGATNRRLDQFAEELSFDRERLRGWGMAQAVMSTLWSLESGMERWRWGAEAAELMSARRG